MKPELNLERLKPHAATGFYAVMLGLLGASLILAGGWSYMHYLVVYAVALFGAYAVFWRFSRRFSAQGGGFAEAWRRRSPAAKVLVAACIVFIALHLIRLRGVPVIDGAFATEYYTVMLIRQDIFTADMNPLWTYGPNLLLKCLLPFLVFYFLFRSRTWTVVVVVIACLYGTSLMNKIFIILPVIPAFIQAVLKRRWPTAVCLSVLPAVCVAFLVLVQNPHLRPQAMDNIALAVRTGLSLEDPYLRFQDRANGLKNRPVVYRDDTAAEADGLAVAADTIYRRSMLVPGQVMSAWFSLVPAQLPYAQGCGYRWLAPFLGCRYVAYASLISDMENPQLVAAGVHGMMNSASFVEDYANFGIVGLVLSGIVFAAVLNVVARLFAGNWTANLALNAIPLLLLLETPLSTVLLTGGWVATLLLYLMMGRDRKSPEIAA